MFQMRKNDSINTTKIGLYMMLEMFKRYFCVYSYEVYITLYCDVLYAKYFNAF